MEEGAISEVLPLAAPGRGTGRWRPRAGPLAEPRAARGGGGGRAECEGLGEGKALGTRWSWQRERWEDEDGGLSEVGLRVGSAVCGLSLVGWELGLWAGEGTDLAGVNLGRGLGGSAGEGVKERG